MTPTKKIEVGASAFSTRSEYEGESQGNIPAHAGSSAPKALKLLHFNDVYNIEARTQEPCGGAARFVTKVGRAGVPASVARVMRMKTRHSRLRRKSCDGA